MTRSELLKRLDAIACWLPTASDAQQMTAKRELTSLMDDITADGVLDVQAPPDIADSMKLPRPTATKIDASIREGAKTKRGREANAKLPHPK